MRHIRIYYSGELASGLTVMLDQNASHHLLQVLRKKVGEQFWVFNGINGEFEATLISENKKIACVALGKFYPRKPESFLKIHLAQGISRGERMDYVIQKSTELGVAEITPLFTEFCQVQLAENRIEKRILHWRAIAISAAEQSGRCAVPIIHAPILFSEWIQKNNSELKLICCLRQTENIFSKISNVPKNIAVTIGAEGGFSDREINAALQNQFISVSLGPRILRTETASVVALTLLQERFGDFFTSNSHTSNF